MHQRASIAGRSRILGCSESVTDHHTIGVADSSDVDATGFNRARVADRDGDGVGPANGSFVIRCR
jgi:hypothetical protein